MSILSTPVKNDMAMQKDIFRFAATLFADNNSVYSALESQLQMIKCLFVKNGNLYLSVAEIAEQLFQIYKYHISDNEIIAALKKHRKTFQITSIDGGESYKLLDDVYAETVELQKNNIDSYIDKFVATFEIVDSEICKGAIHKYLYELTTTNINSYRVLLYGKDETKFTESELSVDVNYLNDRELHLVHDFIDWDNGEKNIALSNIVFACLEYCMLVNGDKPNNLLVSSIRKREIFLDTNIIFRAIGINGQTRKHTVLSFLKKCKQAKLKLIISYQTKIEFETTIKYYLGQISEYPRGDIYLGAHEQLCDYKLFSYYEDWKNEHPNLSLRFFEYYIKSQYEAIVKEYEIKDDVKIPSNIFNSNEFKEKRNRYTYSIGDKKQAAKAIYTSEDYHYSKRDNHDATVVSYIEILRDSAEENKDIFFVSSDKILRFWDMDRSDRNYPIVIYPSQLFLILVKMCGRSDNDFDSFVSFINVKPSRNQISAEKANIILSGISLITEDINTQKILVSAICEGEYQDIINNSYENDELYKAVQSVCQKYLDNELQEQKEKIEYLNETTVQQKEEIASLKHEVSTQATSIDDKQQEIEKHKKNSEHYKEQINSFAEKKTKLSFVFRWYILPAVALLLAFIYVLFISLQFVFCDASWNVVTKLMNIVAGTTFGKNVDGYIAAIDGAAFGVLASIIFPAIWVKPWNKEKRAADKQERIEKYIQKNRLL